MQRLLIIGATGGVGRKVVELGLERGVAITALVRSPEKLAAFADRARIERGDPLSPADVARVARDHDAVVSALGAQGTGPTTVHADGARALVSALGEGLPQRVILVSAAMLFKDGGMLAALLRNVVLRHIAQDSREAERVLGESSLDWTVVRPPRLTNGPRTGRWHVAEGGLPPGPGSISRADVADCVLEQVSRSRHARRILGVTRT